MQFDPQACRNLIAMIFLVSIRDMRQDKIKRDKHEGLNYFLKVTMRNI